MSSSIEPRDTTGRNVVVRATKKLPVRIRASARAQHAARDEKETILDAEVVEELEGGQGSKAHRQSSGFVHWRDRRIRTAGQTFTDSWAEAARIKATAEAADHESAQRLLALYEADAASRAARGAGGSSQDGRSDQEHPGETQAERDRRWLRDMRAGLRDADRQYMDSLRASHIVVPGYGEDQKLREVDALQKVHTRMMMQMCMMPLQRGVSVNSVVQAATTMSALMVLSPAMRAEAGEKAVEVRDYVREKADERTRKHADKVQGKAARGELTAQGIASTDPEDHLSKRWRKRIEDLDRRQRGNREMFTLETAAMTEVGLMDSAYWRMREPGTDPDEVHSSYRSMRRLLHEQMADDGLDRAEVIARARVIIGQRMDVEPEVRTMFNGMAHGRMQKSGPHTVRLPNSDRTVQAWTGEFEDHLGHALPDDGVFVLRKPQNADEHQVRLAQTMSRSIADSLDRGDARDLQSDLYCYPVAFAAQQHGLSTEDLPTGMQHRVNQAQTMIATMASDGLSPDQQREAFSNAYVDAVNEVMTSTPDFEQRLGVTLGHGWDETLARMQRAAQEPAAFVDSMRRTHQQRQAQARAHEQWYPEPGPDPQPQSA